MWRVVKMGNIEDFSPLYQDALWHRFIFCLFSDRRKLPEEMSAISQNV